MINIYLQNFIEQLKSKYETETEYTPIEVALDPTKNHTPEDINYLKEFLTQERKRLFYIQIPNNEEDTQFLKMIAVRSVLIQTAEKELNNTHLERKINPLKLALADDSSQPRPSIQIQKAWALPEKPIEIKTPQMKKNEGNNIENEKFIPLNQELEGLPNLNAQLKALNILNIQASALEQINSHPYAFTDGIIPSNLPTGFYLDTKNKCLCFTQKPETVPNALAPKLEKPSSHINPSPVLLKKIDPNFDEKLLKDEDANQWIEAIVKSLGKHQKEIQNFITTLSPEELKSLIPFLTKNLLLGGETHLCLIIRLIQTCKSKNISLDFLKSPEAQECLLNPRGIKNLQKLTKLTPEQREWWNTLSASHMKNKLHHFDFTSYFEAYTQVFLPRISEKGLVLPNPCPIKHEGHFLVSLNRVLDVLEQAENPQEQCLNLHDLNWSATGVHYAMTQAPLEHRMKQVSTSMQIKEPKDTEVSLQEIQSKLKEDSYPLKQNLFRYLGKHWKKGIQGTDIEAIFKDVEKIDTWSALEKNQWIFILACTFPQNTFKNASEWKQSVSDCIFKLNSLDKPKRTELLEQLSFCYEFKPIPSLSQIQDLIQLAKGLNDLDQNKDFKNSIIIPLCALLKNEGFELLDLFRDRIKKCNDKLDSSQLNDLILNSLGSFITIINTNRVSLSPEYIKILAYLNEETISQEIIKNLLENLLLINKKGELVLNTLIKLLSQFNLSKSQLIPNAQQINELIQKISSLSFIINPEWKKEEQKLQGLNDFIIEKNLLPGAVFGAGDISKLDDLIIDALVDTVKKRGPLLNVSLAKKEFTEVLNSKIVPNDLRVKLHKELFPLIDAIEELMNLLKTNNPKFEIVLAKFELFEKTKPTLLDSTYEVLFSKTTGKYILSFLLTGKKHPEDKITGTILSAALIKVHELMVKEMNEFFTVGKYQHYINDLSPEICISWMNTFNDTQSLSFLFRDELIKKKVVPALTKTLIQLNTQDKEFEQSILNSASHFSDDKPSHIAFREYKESIEAIASYLNILIEIKTQSPDKFAILYKKLQTGSLNKINYVQKKDFVNRLLEKKAQNLEACLNISAQAIDEHPNAKEEDITRAIQGLMSLLSIQDIDHDTQMMFFRMSLNHNLKSTTPFPLDELKQLKELRIEEPSKSKLFNQCIQLISSIPDSSLIESVKAVLQKTKDCVNNHNEDASFCISLIQRLAKGSSAEELGVYNELLDKLNTIQIDKTKLKTILSHLANNKKDESVRMATLLDISNGLACRQEDALNRVHDLFTTPPYPNAHTLSTALSGYDETKLIEYCSSFDTNPYTQLDEKRDLEKHFRTDRIEEALFSLTDMLHEIDLPHSERIHLARQLTYIETLGYTDPLKPQDFEGLKNLTQKSRKDLKDHAKTLLDNFRDKKINSEELEINQLELLAYLREIYYRSTGLFPNTTQMLMLLIALREPSSNLLMGIKTGEGKSLVTPMLAVLQWAQGGTVDLFTANKNLLTRDFENNCEPFFTFLDIPSVLITSNNEPKDYKLGGINCSTSEEMSLFRQAANEQGKGHLLEDKNPIHTVVDECHEALLEQNSLKNLVAQHPDKDSPDANAAQWIYPLVHDFIHQPDFKKVDDDAWDEEEDIEELRRFLNKAINGNANQQKYLMASSNTRLKQWINASCKAAKLVENKHFIIQPVKDANSSLKKMVCVPLIRSIPKTGSIFTEGVQQALQARLQKEQPAQAKYFIIDADPPVLSSQSTKNLIDFYQGTKGRFIGISATPGNRVQLEFLNTQLGIQAISVAPFAGDRRTNYSPQFVFSDTEKINTIKTKINSIKKPVTDFTPKCPRDFKHLTQKEKDAYYNQVDDSEWIKTQTQPIFIIAEDFNEVQSIKNKCTEYSDAGFVVQIISGKESPDELNQILKKAGKVNTITIATSMAAVGTDIDPEHPDGLLVIQTYVDSKIRTTQIAGRAARNGKPGAHMPIYEIKPPKNLLDKILYYLFPEFRKQRNERQIEQIQKTIELNETLDRLYTQAIDEVQQCIIQQMKAWEQLILEVYKEDPGVRYKLYHWRETVLSELAGYQESTISADNIHSAIEHYTKVSTLLWDSVRDDQWVQLVKTQTLNPKQELHFNYLLQLTLKEELKVQRKLQQKTHTLQKGSNELMHLNIRTVIDDKVGAQIYYKKDVQDLDGLAQTKQLLPEIIATLCSIYPDSINTFRPKKPNQNRAFLPDFLNTVLDKVIEQKDNAFLKLEDQQKIADKILKFYQKELKEYDVQAIKTLLETTKEQIINADTRFGKSPLNAPLFKMQGITQNFESLYNKAHLEDKDNKLKNLKDQYHENIMKLIADSLVTEFKWTHEEPIPIHVLFEREAAYDAASNLYTLALKVQSNPKDKKAIHKLYKELQAQKLILDDLFLFSLGHSSPRVVIQRALDSIDSLHFVPECTAQYKVKAHDKVMIKHHLNAFNQSLNEIMPDKKDKAVYQYLKARIQSLSTTDKVQIHQVHELYETLKRYATYEAYKPYRNQINTLKVQLARSIQAIEKDKGIKQNIQVHFFAHKKTQLAQKLGVAEDKMQIQESSDALKHYIELQIEGEDVKEGFTGYKSIYLTQYEKNKKEIELQKNTVTSNLQAIEKLDQNSSNRVHINEEKNNEFNQLRNILEGLKNSDQKEIAQYLIELESFKLDNLEEVISIANKIKEINQMDWTNVKEKLNQSNIENLTNLNELRKKKSEHCQTIDKLKNENAMYNKNSEDQINKIAENEKENKSKYTISTNRVESLWNKLNITYNNLGSDWHSNKVTENNKKVQNNSDQINKLIEQCNIIDNEIKKHKSETILKLETEAKELLTKKLTEVVSTRLNTIKEENNSQNQHLKFKHELNEELAQKEKTKSRFQTKRFFNTGDLLRFEAQLNEEEENIPSPK